MLVYDFGKRWEEQDERDLEWIGKIASADDWRFAGRTIDDGWYPEGLGTDWASGRLGAKRAKSADGSDGEAGEGAAVRSGGAIRKRHKGDGRSRVCVVVCGRWNCVGERT